ncbi:MAG: hypothetical protein A3A44_02020 [Candidatus Sungbacteria bacterium RIFCSPLOWO2_01_FULL_60_25]|uniref:Uncharacterized protein n=1 Tax=Candidatus Sungbacteria bacterium RIFCSPLOWO2_01_FULL_60_25 TaxID=1802281 RepID=A0A1G2LDP0_9BACT|nr:MAG: hypothetical protein A3A44_02020 [Candidatus Sungbacteria bacterium RIFCSPLOWO2_01_FULL_60_25]
MINTQRLLKVGAAWISIVYAICYVGVAIFPGVRPGFMRWGLHVAVDTGMDVLTFGTFVSGLVIWNIVALLGLWLFAQLWNAVRA